MKSTYAYTVLIWNGSYNVPVATYFNLEDAQERLKNPRYGCIMKVRCMLEG